MSEHYNLGNDVEFQLPHIRLSGKCWGDSSKPLLLALHGWLDNADSYVPLAQHLSKYQILAIDWPGHGHSEHRPGLYPLHWIDYLYDLEVLINRLSEKNQLAGLIGHSLGGIVAAAYTAAFPQRVDKLVLMEAVCPLFEPASNNNHRLTNSFASHLQMLRKVGAPAAVYDSIDVAVKARSRLTGLQASWCKLIVERNMQASSHGVSWRSDPRLKLDSPLRLTFEQVDALMTEHEVETLLITADNGYKQIDTLLPKAQVWFKRFSSVKLSGDHHLHMGNAENVAKSIEEFMSK